MLQIMGDTWPRKCESPSGRLQRKIAHSVLPGDPKAVTLVTDHSISIKWPRVKLLELKRGFLHHTVAQRPKICPQSTKNKLSAKMIPKIVCSALSGNSTGVTLAANQWPFIKWPWVKFLRAQEGVPTPQRGSPATKTTWIGKKHAQPQSPLK